MFLNISCVEAARARIRHVYDTFDTVCVQFSGGKDSTAVLYLAKEIHEERGLEAKILYNCLSESDVGKASEFNTIREAYLAAEKEAESLKESGKPLALLVTGSFFTVTAVMELL